MWIYKYWFYKFINVYKFGNFLNYFVGMKNKWNWSWLKKKCGCQKCYSCQGRGKEILSFCFVLVSLLGRYIYINRYILNNTWPPATKKSHWKVHFQGNKFSLPGQPSSGSTYGLHSVYKEFMVPEKTLPVNLNILLSNQIQHMEGVIICCWI